MLRSILAFVLLPAFSAFGAKTAPAAPEKNPATAADTVRYFIELMKSGDVQTASKLVEGITSADLKQGSDQMRSGKTAVSVIDSREDGDLASVIVKVVEDDRTHFSGGPLMKRDGRWILSRDAEGKLDEPGKQRLAALQKWSDERCQELQKSLHKSSRLLVPRAPRYNQAAAKGTSRCELSTEMA